MKKGIDNETLKEVGKYFVDISKLVFGGIMIGGILGLTNDPVLLITTGALAAVKQTGLALEHIPKDIKTKELCLEAVKQDEESIQYVPDNLITEVIELSRLTEKIKTEEMSQATISF